LKFICLAIYKRQNYSIFSKEKKTENYLLPLPVVCNGIDYTSNYMFDNKKVLLSMSGGIDSTVAAILLLREGYSVVGVTYRTWDSVSEGCFEREKGCCTINAILEAKRMAEKMGFPHHFLDIRKEFKDSVVRNFIDEYIAGLYRDGIAQFSVSDFRVTRKAYRLDDGAFFYLKDEQNFIRRFRIVFCKRRNIVEHIERVKAVGQIGIHFFGKRPADKSVRNTRKFGTFDVF